jgi:high-affinity K+ transport system ATPase subunit B
MDEAMIFSIIMFALTLLLYFLPTIIANNRKSTSIWPIFIVNLFLWWTVIFWLVALIWASSSQTKTDKELKELQLEQLRKAREV